MLEVKISVSAPPNTSPLKYDANGPTPFRSFCNAMYLRMKVRARILETEIKVLYLYAENAPGSTLI